MISRARLLLEALHDHDLALMWLAIAHDGADVVFDIYTPEAAQRGISILREVGLIESTSVFNARPTKLSRQIWKQELLDQ